MSGLLAAIACVACLHPTAPWAATPAEHRIPIGIVDLYGLGQVPADQVRSALTFGEGDSLLVVGGKRPKALEESKRRLEALPGVASVAFELVCCEQGRTIVYVGIEAEGAPRIRHRAAPSGPARLAADVVEAGEGFSNALQLATDRGGAGEDRSKGHALANDPAMRGYQERFIVFAKRDLPHLRLVLRSASDPAHRALAAQVLGYVDDKQAVVEDLVQAMDDPSDKVRNSAMRALLVFAAAAPDPGRPRVHVPAEPFVELLHSLAWLDLNKAAGALMQLTASRDPGLLAALRAGSLAPLSEMARWRSEGHAIPAYHVLARIAGYSEEAALGLWSRGEREVVIRAANQEPDTLAREQVHGALGARLDAQLARMADYGFSGTVLVAQDGRIQLLKGYGLANLEDRAANTPSTRFEMNSMTKMFTGAAILQLAAAGRLRLDDPVARHLDGLPSAKQTATIEQLASHTSGLVVAGTPLAGDSRDAFVRDVAATPRESAPGERYRYTNAGFSLLAAIIETVSGEAYEQYLRRHLFVPAGMTSAMFRSEVRSDDASCAHGYVGTPAGPEPGPPNPYVWGTVGAGGVWSTVGDMYRWLVAVEDGRILPETQRRILFSPPRPPAEEAFGWHVHNAPDGRFRIDKGGGSDDFASQLLYYPRERLIAIWATNSLRERWRRTLAQVIPAVAFDTDTFRLPPVVSLPQADLAPRAGRFVAAADTLELVAGAGCLYARPNRLGIPDHVRFFPQDRDHFTAFDPATGAVARLEFSRANGDSITLTLPDGARWSARRPAPASVHSRR